MFEYKIAKPGYQPFPYEETLAQHELVALANGTPLSGSTVATPLRISPEVLRRIAFSSRVSGHGVEVTTDVSLLEQATLALQGRHSGRKESNYLTHGLHRFKGKFYPQLARALLNHAKVSPGDLVVDPFAGSGTSLVEAWLLGVDALGFDVNPLAVLIARTKVRMLRTPAHSIAVAIERFEDDLIRLAKAEGIAWGGLGEKEPPGRSDYEASRLAALCGVPGAEAELRGWFPGSVRHKLAITLQAIDSIAEPGIQDFLKVCLSDQLRSCSQQDPRDLRMRRRPEPIRDAPLFTMTVNKAISEMKKIRAGQDLTRHYPWKEPNVDVQEEDTRTLAPGLHPVLAQHPVDAVVSSPPYATALPYVDTERLSFTVLGLMSHKDRSRLEKEIIGSREIPERWRRSIEQEMLEGGLARLPSEVGGDIREIMETNEKFEVGFRKRNTAALLYRYFTGMRRSLENVSAAMRVGAEARLVLGDSKTVLGDGRQFQITTCSHIVRIAEQVGFSWEKSIPITVTTQNFAHVKNAITENEVIVLRKC